MYSMKVSGWVAAGRAAVYRALLDPVAVEQWRVPDGMSGRVHEFDARPGGAFRVSLTYSTTAGVGKTSTGTDTYQGRFVTLVPDREVVEELEFETDDPALGGRMTITTTLRDCEGGTDVVIRHDGIPDAVAAADNELGTRMGLAKLRALVEAGEAAPDSGRERAAQPPREVRRGRVR
jgi:uncharacterized protein YndB with AHSA1/START domain